MSTADYQREWRARHGARTGQPGRPATEPCGTIAAYRRHKANGEPVDDACREEYNRRQREWYAARRGASHT